MKLWKIYGLGLPFVVNARSREHAELVVSQLYPVSDPFALWIKEHEPAIAH